MGRVTKNQVYMLWFYLFLGSFLAGVFLMNMGNETLLTENGLFSVSSIERLKYIEIDNGRFFQYVLKHRMGEGAVLILLSSTGIGIVSIYASIVCQGILAGMTITAAIMRFGIKGLLLLLGGLFPHQLLLIPAGIMLLGWCYENCTENRLRGEYGTAYYGSKRQKLLRQGIGLLWIATVVLIGCILESYVNPILISDLVKIF